MRHPEVHDDGIGGERRGQDQRLVAVRGFDDLVAGVPEELPVHVTAVLDVVDEEDERPRARLLPGGGGAFGVDERRVRSRAGVPADDLCHYLARSLDSD